jgi:3-hydroxyacyl-CoA dehydrogenase
MSQTLATSVSEAERERALKHVAFAEKEAARIPDIAESTPTRPIAKAAVIGAGTMGGGIAMSLANAGISVVLLDSTQAFLDRGLERMKANYAITVSRGRLDQAEMDRRLARIHGTIDMDSISDADIVIEAVPEEMLLKQEIFRKIDALAKPGAILATNTSGLDINQIAAVTRRPEDVVGAHFFSPANVMRLLEVVRATATSKDVIATLMQLGRTMGKIPVLARIYDGFIGNALLRNYIREAHFLLEEGALPQQVDKALTDFGFAMGIFGVHDMAGNDVGYRNAKAAIETRPKDRRYCDLIVKLCDLGRLGQKTGAGWYRYEKGSRTPISDPFVTNMIEEESRLKGIARRSISDEEIIKRCLYGMINEGARLLEQGIAMRPSDIDICYVSGYGFPAWRGGPMYYADMVGVANVYADVARFHKEHGYWWQPAPLLEKLAKEGRSFASLQAGN